MNELTRDEIDAFLDEQVVGRLGCHDEQGTYVVPLIYARHGSALYLLTTEGRKIRAMRKDPAVCFEVDHFDAATGSWRSVIVRARYHELDEQGKNDALAILSQRYGRRRPPSGEPRATPPTVAFRLHIESVSGRAERRGD
jgi:nitroimidazol reductase NimA-like FMN-containing flavoprotein (pyridoxamine 5'-phosphate oxidase superfamily)